MAGEADAIDSGATSEDAGADGPDAERRPHLSLVVTSVGRPDAFGRLLDSLTASDPGTTMELILVDQDPEQGCSELLRRRELPFPARATTSGRGASVGRNAGIALARGELIGFPDDDCWYPPGTVRRAIRPLDENPSLGGISGRAMTGDGQPCMLRWLTDPEPVTATNYQRTSIAFTLFLRRSVLDLVGGFDEGMGPGSAGWLGAGEESDLVLRLIQAGITIDYDPQLVVHHDEPRREATADYVAKMLRYGSAQGHLWRRYRASPGTVAYQMLRKVGGAVLHGVRGELNLGRADLAYLRGCVAGLRNIPPAALRRS